MSGSDSDAVIRKSDNCSHSSKLWECLCTCLSILTCPGKSQVWILWVPVADLEQKSTIGYTDNSVTLTGTVEEVKAPTSRRLQEMKEKIQEVWANEDSISCLEPVVPGSSSASSMAPAPPFQGSWRSGAGNNKKGKTQSQGSRKGATMPDPMQDEPHSIISMSLEAAKYKKNTVKDKGLGRFGGLGEGVHHCLTNSWKLRLTFEIFRHSKFLIQRNIHGSIFKRPGSEVSPASETS